MNTVDCVVIGAGNGGLAASLRLAKSGKKVVLVERHILPGGFATSFKRGRFNFEASLHELCDFGHEDNPGNLYNLFKELEVVDKIKMVDVPEAFRVITLSTKEDYIMPFGIENFVNKMEEYVPGSRKSVQTFFDLGKEIKQAMRYLTESRGKPDSKVLMAKYPNFMRVAPYNVDKVLKAIKMPKKARDILTTYWTYLGAPSKRLGFIHYCIMVYLYISLNAQIPINRSHDISMTLASEIENNGGKILYGREVKKIIVEDNKVKGVILDDGTTINTNHVISNANPHSVYGKMIDKELIPLKSLQKANFSELSGKGFSMFLGLNKSKEELGLKEYSYFIYNSFDSNKEFKLMHDINNTSQVVVCLNNALPDCSPKGTTILYFTTLFYKDAFSKVVTKENYFKLKDQLTENFISTFEKAVGVKIRDSIEEIEVATPLTYAHYTDTPDGAIYGYLTADLDNMMPRLMRMYNEDYIDGLKFCGGHAMRSSGYNSSYLSGDLAAKFTLGDIKEEGK